MNMDHPHSDYDYDEEKLGVTAPLSDPFDMPVDADNPTLTISHNSQLHRKLMEEVSRKNNATLTSRELRFMIRGMEERINVKEGMTIILGRIDPTRTTGMYIDLTPYGALERGVSREHVRLEVLDNQLFVTDLGSSNGTYLNEKRLIPHEAYTLPAGTKMMMGKLVVQVLFD